MMPITRSDLEILLDSPEQTDYVVSAFADLTVKDGFRHFASTQLGEIARQAGVALSEAEARTALDEHVGPILEAVGRAAPGAKGFAAFSAPGRGLFHAIELPFPIENRLMIDEDPCVRPLLEHWYGDPSYLVALVDSHELHLFEAHSGRAEHVAGLNKEVPAEMQRDKPRFTYKKRFNDAWHERQQQLTNDEFLKEVAGIVSEHYRAVPYTGLILLGQAATTSAVRRLLHKEAASAVVLEHAQSMRPMPRAEDVEDDVARAMKQWKSEERSRLLGELEQRWARGHLVANGPTEVLDALQQGRAVEIVFGADRSMPGSRCSSCGYRFGAPTAQCVYCGGRTSSVDAAQEIMRMALRQRIASVHLLDRPDSRGPDPMERSHGVAALLRAEANWTPTEAEAP
jgi:peptide subunit release factor 1 (eRF1)